MKRFKQITLDASTTFFCLAHKDVFPRRLVTEFLAILNSSIFYYTKNVPIILDEENIVILRKGIDDLVNRLIKERGTDISPTKMEKTLDIKFDSATIERRIEALEKILDEIDFENFMSEQEVFDIVMKLANKRKN